MLGGSVGCCGCCGSSRSRRVRVSEGRDETHVQPGVETVQEFGAGTSGPGAASVQRRHAAEPTHACRGPAHARPAMMMVLVMNMASMLAPCPPWPCVARALHERESRLDKGNHTVPPKQRKRTRLELRQRGRRRRAWRPRFRCSCCRGRRNTS